MCKFSYTFETINFSNSVFKIHPRAIHAFSVSQEYEQQYKLESLSQQAILNLQHQNPLRVLCNASSSGKKTYWFFGGWSVLTRLSSFEDNNIEIDVLKLKSNESDKDVSEYIESYAWTYIYSLEFLSKHRKSALRYMHDLLAVDNHVTREIMTNQSRRIPAMMKITGESRASLRTQCDDVRTDTKLSELDVPVF